ncbi:MAG: hypothetical protein AABX93_00220 [Nanoarchaeota archaeon]
MNKKGFLLAEETLKIVIAMICMVLLIYFLVTLYFGRINEVNFEQAKQTLIDSPESVKKAMDGLSDGGSKTMTLANPIGWKFLSFTENPRPSSCAGSNCICICKTPFISYLTEQAVKCDDKESGICFNNQNIEQKNFNMEIKKDLTKISIKKTNGIISITEQ